ncbi:HIRAN domain-containing protein [Nocardioides dubius]|uniref:HIRAN domain-containing protein n=1 Tax=Nocardioides dubius TaxID=317019 RepID=A0ABP4E4L2_9ACTN
MWVVVLVVLVVLVVAAVVIWQALTDPAAGDVGTHTQGPPSERELETGLEGAMREVEARAAALMPEVEARAAALMPEVEAEVARLQADLLRGLSPGAESLRLDEPGPEPQPERLSLGPDGGPTWMDPADWADRVASYTRQGRTATDIREVAEYLERRGPRTPRDPAAQKARAKRAGYVARTEYLSPEEEADVLVSPSGGLPDLWLEHVRDRLLVVSPRGWVNPRSRTAASRAGLWSFGVRGTSHHERAARAGDFRPGAPVVLVREPQNAHDPNAIGVYASGATELAGYVPRGFAKRLTPILDGGADMVAVSTRGGGPGEDTTPQVLVVERRLWTHLHRKGSATR